MTWLWVFFTLSSLSPRCGEVALKMVAIAQLVEHRIVVPRVVGSSPISHPIHRCFGCRDAELSYEQADQPRKLTISLQRLAFQSVGC